MSEPAFSRAIGDTGLRLWSMTGRDFVIDVPGLPNASLLSAADCALLAEVAQRAAAYEERRGKARTVVAEMATEAWEQGHLERRRQDRWRAIFAEAGMQLEARQAERAA